MINFIILITSTIIYISFGISNFIYILFSTLTTFYAAKKMNSKNRKRIFWITLILNSLILIVFKLISFNNLFNLISRNSVIIPLGISYYTFQVLSYLIDVYKNKYEPEKKLFNYFLYIMYLPYLFIGPISRYDKIKDTLFKKRKITESNFFNGLLRITWGLFKKMVIAGRIAIIISTITSNYNLYKGAFVLFALLLYSIQLYNDFSGGIDIVIGFSKMLGIKLEENFNKPYFSENIKEFWRKWHISLSNWLKDYIYIPLGGNRCSKFRNKINIIITFIISGLWHGFNYFLWGLIHGILVAFCPKRKSNFKILNCCFNFIIVSLLWIFFIYPTSSHALKMFLTIFTSFNYNILFSNILKLGLDLANMIVLLISILILMIYETYNIQINNWLKARKTDKKLIIILTFGILILIFGIYGFGFNINEFIYSKF